MNSLIPPETLEAYRVTHYRVMSETSFILRVGEYSQILRSLHTTAACESSAFLTAWNPFGELCTDEVNNAAQRQLIAEIEVRSLAWLSGEGVDPNGTWPGEPSLLILGISCEEAKRLGVTFKQNALLWMDSRATPELILLR